MTFQITLDVKPLLGEEPKRCKPTRIRGSETTSGEAKQATITGPAAVHMAVGNIRMNG